MRQLNAEASPSRPMFLLACVRASSPRYVYVHGKVKMTAKSSNSALVDRVHRVPGKATRGSENWIKHVEAYPITLTSALARMSGP